MNASAIGYIRVSTKEQAEEGISLEMQEAKIRAYCLLNDLELVEIVSDAGISGKSIKARPGIQRVLSLVKARKIGAVVVYKLDRLGRNAAETLTMATMMDKANVGLHSITEKLDTQSAMGRFFFSLTASLAEMERGLIGERTRAALSQKRANGYKTGGDRPYGFDVDADGRLIPNHDEQETIRRIEALRTMGYSYARISKALTAEGILTRRGTSFAPNQIVRILSKKAA